MFIMSKEEYKKAVQELNVNLARLGATDDLEELKTVYVAAQQRLERIYLCRYEKLNKKEPVAVAVVEAEKGNYVQQELFSQDN